MKQPCLSTLQMMPSKFELKLAAPLKRLLDAILGLVIQIIALEAASEGAGGVSAAADTFR